jgi:hypothetical protein
MPLVSPMVAGAKTRRPQKTRRFAAKKRYIVAMNVIFRNRLTQPAEDGVHEQRDDEGAHEQPADGVHAAGHAEGLAGRSQDLEGDQDAEEVEGGHEDGADFLLLDIHDPLKHRRHPGSWLWLSGGHVESTVCPAVRRLTPLEC